MFYFGLLKWAFSKFRQKFWLIPLAVLFWVILERIESIAPIGTLGTDMFFFTSLPFLQIALIAGFVGLQAAIIGLNASLALLIQKRNFFTAGSTVFFVLLLAGIYLWGQGRLREKNETPKKEIKLALIQHNLPMDPKWRRRHSKEIKSQYEALALQAAEKKPELIIFPLYTLQEDIYRSPEFFSELARQTKTYILAAAHVPKDPGSDTFGKNFTDTAILYSPEGSIAGEYRAVQRAPFRGKFEITEKEYKILDTPFGKVGILLCFEDTRPQVAKRAVKAGAQFLVALSNPGFFSTTHVPYYHLVLDQLRAIETNLWLARIVPNGYSAIVDSKGRIKQKSELNQEGILYGTLTVSS